MNIMNISMNLGRMTDTNEDIKHRLLYKPLELELQSINYNLILADGGLKTIKNGFNLDE